MRVKMVVAYDGTNYSGWQIQPNGVTIEQKLNEALQALLGEDIRVTGASRTDAGVHSLGNVCIFDTDTRMPAEKISYALNQRLPEDIVVQDSCEVPTELSVLLLLPWLPVYPQEVPVPQVHVPDTSPAAQQVLPPQAPYNAQTPASAKHQTSRHRDSSQ